MQMDRSRVVLRRCSRRLRHGEMWRAWQQWRSMVLRQGQASTSLRMLDSSLIRMVRQSLYRSFATWRSVVQERERESALEAQRQLMQEHRMRQALVYLGHVRKRSDGDRLRHAWHVLQLHVHSLAAASALADATSALEEARSSAADEQRRRGERLLLMRISGRMRHRGLLRGWLTWVRFAHESVVERIRCASQSSVDELSSRLVSYGEEHRRRVLSRWSRRLTKGLLWKGWHSWLAAVASSRMSARCAGVLRRGISRMLGRSLSMAFTKWRVTTWVERDSEEAAMAAEEVDARELAMQMDRSRVVLRRCSRRLRHGEMWRAWQQWRSMVLRQGQASTSLRMLDSSLIRMVRQSLYRSFATWRSVVQERERESALEAQRQLMQEHRMRQALVYLGHVRKRSDGDRLRHAWHVLQLHVHSLAAASALADATSALEEARSSAADEQRRRGERLLLMRISGRMRHRGLLRGWLTWVRFAHESVVERIRCASQSSVDELSSRLVSYGEEHRRRVLSRWSRRLTKGLLWKGWHSWLAAVASSRMSARCAGVLRRGISRMLGRSLSMAFTKWRVTTWVEREAEGAVAVVGVRPDRSSRYGREGVIAMGEMPLGSADALRMRLRRSLLLIIGLRHSETVREMRRSLLQNSWQTWMSFAGAGQKQTIVESSSDEIMSAKEAKFSEFLKMNEEAYMRLKILLCQCQATVILFQPLIRSHDLRLCKSFRHWRDVIAYATARFGELASACSHEREILDERLQHRSARLTALQGLRRRSSRYAQARALHRWHSWTQQSSFSCRIIVNHCRFAARRRMQSALVRWRMAGYDAKCRLADANVAVLAEQDKAYRSILAQLELNSRSVQRQWVAEHEHAVLVKERRLKGMISPLALSDGSTFHARYRLNSGAQRSRRRPLTETNEEII